MYVEFAGKPALVRQDVELMIAWLNRIWADLEERDNFGGAANRAQARALFDQGIAHYKAKLQAAK